MKRLLLLTALFSLNSISAQIYQSHNIELISLISPNTSTVPTTVGNRYSGCWGWYQSAKNKEYAISGGSNGTYFIDVSNPATPSVSAFVPGKECTWREMKTYGSYCYVVSDYCRPNNFQIIDMQYLPDSVHVVHNGTNHFELGHTVFIDKDKMYVGITTFAGNNGSAMTVWTLANPEAPGLLRRIEQDSASVGKIHEVHDMFVRNDTVYASAAWQGLRILKLQGNNTFSLIASYDGYSSEGYNHSSWLTQNGRYLLFCDEVPSSLPMHLVDLQNMANIQPVAEWKPFPQTTPHNPYIIGNRHAVVSCYQDGIYIYDISQPPGVSQVGFFDTYPQGGANTPTTVGYGNGAYKGNWGAYPYLPSGILIANDMQNGVFILDAQAAYNNPVGLSEERFSAGEPMFYPNPANTKVTVFSGQNSPSQIKLANVLGEIILTTGTNGQSAAQLDVSNVAAGTYILSVYTEKGLATKKLIITH